MSKRIAIPRLGLSTTWERRVIRTAKIFAFVALIISLMGALLLTREGTSAWVSMALALLITFLVYAGMEIHCVMKNTQLFLSQ